MLYHGSPSIIKKPIFGFGKPYNDYGLGFYCTEEVELAKEWACPLAKDGFANIYDFDTDRTISLNCQAYSNVACKVYYDPVFMVIKIN